MLAQLTTLVSPVWNEDFGLGALWVRPLPAHSTGLFLLACHSSTLRSGAHHAFPVAPSRATRDSPLGLQGCLETPHAIPGVLAQSTEPVRDPAAGAGPVGTVFSQQLRGLRAVAALAWHRTCQARELGVETQGLSTCF